jgi:hypothetical protein
MTSTFILASLIEPAIGLIFWTTITFILLLVLLGKFAWKPILTAIKTREKGIEDALASAENALNDMRELKSNNEKMYELEFDNAATIKVTGNHKFLTTVGWVRADELTGTHDIISKPYIV